MYYFRCDDYDRCREFPCYNGECVFLGHDRFDCDCHAGYYGDLCRSYNPCASSQSPCENQGTCNLLPGEGVHFECDCRPGYYGPLCEYFDACVGKSLQQQFYFCTHKCICLAINEILSKIKSLQTNSDDNIYSLDA